MKKALAIFLFALAAVSYAENVSISGSYNVTYDQFTEVNGKPKFSMNGTEGNIFGLGDYKKSSNDNVNDNRNTFKSVLD